MHRKLGSSHFDGYERACKAKGLVFSRETGLRLVKTPQGRVIGAVRDLKSSEVGSVGVSISNNKALTNSLMRSGGLPIPRQFSFKIADFERALSEKYRFPLVLKPADGKGGEGVVTGIGRRELFEQAMKSAADVQRRKDRVFVLEESIDAFDLRVSVVGNRYNCACVRVPAHVVGNGVATVAQRVAKKDEVRTTHPHHKRFPLGAAILNEPGAIPANEEIVLLSQASNIHQGGEACDVTDLVRGDLRRLAEMAVSAVPNLNVAGGDLLVKSLTSAEGAVVLEINAAANYAIHYYPYYGDSRNPAGAVVDLMIERATKSKLQNSTFGVA